MFTGIVEELGQVLGLERRSDGASLAVACSLVLTDAVLGSSIAVNGACLTVVELGQDRWAADVSPETLRRTNLGNLRAGSLVNLERPMRADSRLNGHFVLGHVDGTASVVALESVGDNNWWLRLRIPGELNRYIVNKGSLAVDGISLTVAELSQDLAAFTVIPHTYRQTTLHTLGQDSLVNVEVDILAKHIEKLMRR